MKKGLRLVSLCFKQVLNSSVGRIDLMKKGLRPDLFFVNRPIFSMLVGRIDLMKKGLRR